MKLSNDDCFQFIDTGIIDTFVYRLVGGDMNYLGSNSVRFCQVSQMLRSSSQRGGSIDETKSQPLTIQGTLPAPLQFFDIAIRIQCSGFLDVSSVAALELAHPDLVSNSLVLPTSLSKPWQPIRKRRWGFGKASTDRTLAHDRPNPHSMIHYAWTFLTPQDRRQAMRAFPQWRSYAELRHFAGTHDVQVLRQQRLEKNSS